MDARFRAIEASTDMAALDTFYQKAYDLLKSPAARKAFDIGAEKESLRELYGRTPVGQGALLARRLVESGVRFATVAKGWTGRMPDASMKRTMSVSVAPSAMRIPNSLGQSALNHDPVDIQDGNRIPGEAETENRVERRLS